MPSLFQSISSFFSTTASREHSHIRRDQAMSSIDDAFSVPPDAEYVSSPAVYTYPPPAQGASYDTVPYYDQRSPLSAASSSARPAPLLPLHSAPIQHYPPLQQTWARLRAWLDEQYPELADTLNWGLPPPELAHLELQLGLALPPAVRDSYLLVDGQEAESAAGCAEGLFFGLTLLPFDDVVDEWRFWREVDDDPATGANAALRDAMRSVPPGWIRREYSQRGWLPLVADKGGNYLGIDMNPDERGAAGQVIVFGRDFDTKVVMWRGDGAAGWARWLASFVEELESGEGFEVGGEGGGSEGSEDDVGYESYFYDGSGKGEGGGEGGGGGLRLTGEYRGWPVLEALADRSMKRWIEAGVMAQPTTPVQATSPNAVELGLDPAPDTPTPKKSGRASPTQANGDPRATHASLPSISTKAPAPAPLPVQLPTEQDLLPSPTYPSRSLVYDEEEAIDLPMREVDRATPVQAHFGSPPEGTLVPLPPAEAPPMHRQATDPLVNEDQALLTEAASPAAEDALSAAILTPTPVDPPDAPPEEEEEATPQPSVRLVGGGAVASLVDAASDPDKDDGGARKTEAA